MNISLSINKSFLIKKFKKLARLAKDDKIFNLYRERLKPIIEEDLTLRFQSSPSTTRGGIVYGGVFWKPLSKTTLRLKPYRRYGKIHIDTGEMSNILCDFSNNKFNFIYVSANKIFIGTRFYKAIANQSRRPIIFWHPRLSEQAIDLFRQTILDYYYNDNY